MTERNALCVALFLDPLSVGHNANLSLEAAHLDTIEHQRFLSFRHEASKRNFLCGRVLAKNLVGRHLGCAARDVRIGYDANGKPVIADPMSAQALTVSISHTDGMVAVALSTASKLGIDVEKVDRPALHLPISNRILAEHEMRDVLAYSREERVDRFLQYWTLKEAWAKSVGAGLRAKFCEIEFDLSPPAAHVAALSEFRSGEQWHISLLRIGVKHLLALCDRNRDATPIEWLVWDSRMEDAPLSQATQLQIRPLSAALTLPLKSGVLGFVENT